MEKVHKNIIGISHKNLSADIRSNAEIGGKFVWIEKYTPADGKITICFEDWIGAFDGVVLDSIIANCSAEIEDQPLIVGVAHSSVLGKPFELIDYKIELQNNEYLQGIPSFYDETGKRGLVKDVIYYKGFENEANPGIEHVRVSHQWTVDPSSSLFPCSYDTNSRDSKEWKYKKANGEYHSKTKKKGKKVYDTYIKRNEEGIRKRQNIINLLQPKIATALVVCGITTEANVPVYLTSIWHHFNNEMSAYIKSGEPTFDVNGEEDVYHAIGTTVDYPEFDNVVPDNATTQFLIPEMVGLDIRTSFIEKLKGNI